MSWALAIALLAGLAACAEPAPRLVVVIGVDTLAASHLGLYGAERPTSPFLDRLAEDGVVFEHAYATSSWTLPSFASIFTGRLQSGHGAGIRVNDTDDEWNEERVAHRRVILDPSVPTLAEMLAAAGFTTLAVAQNPNLDPAFGVARGFDVYDYVMGSHANKRRAEVVVDRSLALIDEHAGDDLFVFIHFFDPHMSYGAPSPYGGMFTGGLDVGYGLPIAVNPREIDRRAPELPEDRRRFIAAAYDGEIRYLDSQLERLVGGLRERGLWDDALVILTADHGEELFEHDGFEHGHSLYDEVIAVPLIVWAPGLVAGRSTAPVSIADVTPTVLDFEGMEIPEGIFGIPLRPLLRGSDPAVERLIVAEGILYGSEKKAALRWPYKLILDREDGTEELFDLRQDPGERRTLADGERIAELREQLELALAAAAQGVTLQQLELDEELQRRLRALGYIR
ncbi:MAG: sulfatase [Acidobacteriota bacterium]